jgi:methionyl-tRNA formyltransferase
MKIGWIGFHMEGIPALAALLEQRTEIAAVITLKPDMAIKRSGAVDYSNLCAEYGVPLYEIGNVNEPASIALLRSLSLDILFVIGWTQILRAEALAVARMGVIGAHASLLPHNRGRAPINWAILRGEKQTGNSLMWLADGVDSGDLIDQTVFAISSYDTCKSLYEKVAMSNRDMILRLIPKLLQGERPARPQIHSGEALLPARRPEDGLVNWTASSQQIYDFIRGLTRPYPGAFSYLDGQLWRIWECSLLPCREFQAEAGTVLGSVYSTQAYACGQMVACGSGAVVLLEIEPDSEGVLQGPALSDREWCGKIWGK